MQRYQDFDRIRRVMRSVAPDEPLTAREINEILEEHGFEYDSAHRIATILGRHSDSETIDVIEANPYRYRFRSNS